MYTSEVPIISRAMRAEPDSFARGILFAVLSARQPILRVPPMLRALDRGDRSGLFGWKYETWEFLQRHATRTWEHVMAADTTREALLRVTKVPGLGLTKGAFVLQMMGHNIACLDSRNLDREGLDRNTFKLGGDSTKSKPGRKQRDVARLLDQYLKLTCGRAAELWDVWCTDVARDNDMTADEISKLHLIIAD